MTEYRNGKQPWLEITQMQFVGAQSEGKLIIGYGVSSRIGEYAAKIATGSAMLIADPAVVRLGTMNPIKQSLETSGFDCDVFTGVKPEPHLADTVELVTQIRSKKYGLVVGIGGGSAMDTAKLAALAAVTDLSIEEYFEDSSKVSHTLPKILVPTTSGTGSEVSPYIVMADKNGKKLFIGSSNLYATIALVDPQMTVTMPSRGTAATGLDALTHGVEGMTGAKNPYTLAIGTKCAELVFQYLPRAVENGGDLEARYYMSFASVLGMMAYTLGGGLYAHSMSYILTAEKGLPHGAGCGLALAYTMAFNGTFAEDVDSSLRNALGTNDVPNAILTLVREVGMPTSLSEIGYTKTDVPELARMLLNEYYRLKNPRCCTAANAERLLMNMLLGRLDF